MTIVTFVSANCRSGIIQALRLDAYAVSKLLTPILGWWLEQDFSQATPYDLLIQAPTEVLCGTGDSPYILVRIDLGTTSVPNTFTGAKVSGMLMDITHFYGGRMKGLFTGGENVTVYAELKTAEGIPVNHGGELGFAFRTPPFVVDCRTEIKVTAQPRKQAAA